MHISVNLVKYTTDCYSQSDTELLILIQCSLLATTVLEQNLFMVCNLTWSLEEILHTVSFFFFLGGGGGGGKASQNYW